MVICKARIYEIQDFEFMRLNSAVSIKYNGTEYQTQKHKKGML